MTYWNETNVNGWNWPAAITWASCSYLYRKTVQQQPNQTASDPRQISTLINYVVIFRKMNFWNFVKFDKLSNVLDKEIGLDDSLLWNKQSMED